MNIQLPVWQAILILIAFFGCIFGFGKVLLDQFEKRLQERFTTFADAQSKNSSAVQMLERDFLKWQAELPLQYVRREDYVRGQSVIEAKLDALYNKMEVLQLKGVKND
jgi:hypothetical protein